MLRSKKQKGYSLIELMIVLAIISILSAIAVPNFLAYRDKSRFYTALTTGESIRAALSGYAATNTNNLYPLSGNINSWNDLQAICVNSGVTLGPMNSIGISAFNSYISVSGITYSLTYDSNDSFASTITIAPEGITATFGVNI